AHDFYKNYKLKRVYYSGYIPINNSNSLLPQIGSAPPLVRENRLYQTDWLLRFYGFQLDEILNPQHIHLDLDIDPKLSWALRKDRKSTRLNSSHVKISYAVFCLKKKNNAMKVR